MWLFTQYKLVITITQQHVVVNNEKTNVLNLRSGYYMNSSSSSHNHDTNPDNTENWLTTIQVIQLLDISRNTLYRLESEGKLVPVELPGNKILKHRRIRFSREAVESLMLEFDYDCSVTTPYS